MSLAFYPSSWYYNASMQGLLQIISEGLGAEFVERDLLQEDGSLFLSDSVLRTILSTNVFPPEVHVEDCSEVPPDLNNLKRIAWWWCLQGIRVRKTENEPWTNQEKVDKTVSSFFVGNKGLYVNLIQSSSNKEDFLNQWFTVESHSKGSQHCSFCGQPFSINFAEKPYYHYLTSAISSSISSSTAFPNLFFDGQPASPICQHCRWPLICFHLVSPAGLFINAGSFLLNWHINQLIAGHSVKYEHRFSRLIDSVFSESRLSSTLGAWGLQGIEVILISGTKVNHYLVSDKLARLLLNPSVAGPLGRINAPEVQAMILSDNFAELSNLLYRRLREALNDKTKSYLFASNLAICRLYGALLNAQNGGEKMDINRLIYLGNEAPIKLKEDGRTNNSDLNLIYRLLELARNNQRSEAYHLLLRKYIAAGVTFPADLSRIFSYDDSEMFKNAVFSYVAGISSKSQN